METTWVVLIFAGAIVAISVIGAVLGLNFDIVLSTLKDFMLSLKTKAQANKAIKKGAKDTE